MDDIDSDLIHHSEGANRHAGDGCPGEIDLFRASNFSFDQFQGTREQGL